MSGPYDYEGDHPPEGPGSPEERPAARLKGTVTALLVGAAAVFALITAGGRAADWVNGMGRFGGGGETVEIQPGRSVAVEIPSGASARLIAGMLVDNGVIRSAASFESVVRARGAGGLLKAGRYELAAGAGLEELVDILVAGPTVDIFRLTVVEGRRIGEVLEDVARQTEYSEQELAAALLEGEISSDYLPGELPEGVDGLAAWEGLLFPATYDFYRDASPEEILQRLADETELRMERIDWTPVRRRGFTPYEAMVMASLIEAEAGIDADRPLIADVIYNRLNSDTPLQLDASVLYAMGERGRGLSLADLEFDSLYNTYRIAGLPPTPIGASGFKSLQAVADPAGTDFFYYVLTSEDGAHSFFVDYDDFLQAKRRAEEQGIGL